MNPDYAPGFTARDIVIGSVVTAAIGLGSLAVIDSIRPASACGTTDVCADVQASFWGHILTEGIKVGWSTNDEQSPVAAYRVWRCDGSNCSDPALVVTVQRTGSCSSLVEYERTDLAGESGDDYILDVVLADNTVPCNDRITPVLP